MFTPFQMERTTRRLVLSLGSVPLLTVRVRSPRSAFCTRRVLCFVHQWSRYRGSRYVVHRGVLFSPFESWHRVSTYFFLQTLVKISCKSVENANDRAHWTRAVCLKGKLTGARCDRAWFRGWGWLLSTRPPSILAATGCHEIVSCGYPFFLPTRSSSLP